MDVSHSNSDSTRRRRRGAGRLPPPASHGRLAATLVALFSILLPTTAAASGFFLPGRGVRPMGRAGAYVAAGEGNLNSLWYNPANLAVLEDTNLTVDASLIGTFARFHRAPRTAENGDRVTYDEVSNEAPPHLDPQLLVGGETGIDGLKWAGGVWAPYATHQRFPRDGPQRYTLIDNSDSILAYIGIALAWEVTDSLRIGAGFQNMVANFEFVNVTSAYTGLYGRPEDRDLDVFNKAIARDFFVPTGNAGIWFEPVDHLQLAGSVQLPAFMRDRDARIRVRMPSHPSFDGAELSNKTFESTLQLPFIARAAVRYARDSFDVELAGVYEDWSVFDEIEVNPDDMEVRNVPGIGAVPLGALSVPHHWNDTFSLRLGGAYHFSSEVTARLGYTFETGATPDAYHTVFTPDADKHVFGAGFTYDVGPLELDTSAGYYALQNRSIRNSRVRQINPVDTEDELATIVGNGDYRSAILIVGTGINYRF